MSLPTPSTTSSSTTTPIETTTSSSTTTLTFNEEDNQNSSESRSDFHEKYGVSEVKMSNQNCTKDVQKLNEYFHRKEFISLDIENYFSYLPKNLQTPTIDDYIPMVWKLNIIASYEDYIFIATGKKILIFHIHDNICQKFVRNQLCFTSYVTSENVKISSLNSSNQTTDKLYHLETSGKDHVVSHVASMNLQEEINQIRIGTIGSSILLSKKNVNDQTIEKNVDNEPCLFAVGNNGYITLFYLKDLEGNVSVKRSTNLTFNNENESTWAIAACGNYCAVGANSHKITIYEISTQESFFITGSRHNVPSIDFSPCGNMIASASIDTYLRIWSLEECKIHAEKKKNQTSTTKEDESNENSPVLAMIRPCKEWGWSVRWVSAQSIKLIPTSNKTFWNEEISEFLEILENVDSDHESIDSLGLDDDDDDDDDANDNSNEMDDIQYLEDNNNDDTESDDQFNDIEIQEHDSCEINPNASKENNIQSFSTKQKKEDDSYHYDGDFLIYCTKHHIFLISHSKSSNDLKICDVLYYNPRRVLQYLPQWMLGLSRLSLVEYVPELSLLLVASQSDNKVLLLRIARNEDWSQIKLFPERILPSENDDIYPIAAITVHKINNSSSPLTSRFRLYILNINKQLYIYEISNPFSKSEKIQVTLNTSQVVL